MRPIILDKAENFAVRVVKAKLYLNQQKNEFKMADQLSRSGTSIQANIAEAQYAQSKADFISKYQIALKEANEARNWINVLYRTEYFDKQQYDSIYNDVNQIVMILIAIIRKLKEKKDEDK